MKGMESDGIKFIEEEGGCAEDILIGHFKTINQYDLDLYPDSRLTRHSIIAWKGYRDVSHADVVLSYSGASTAPQRGPDSPARPCVSTCPDMLLTF